MADKDYYKILEIDRNADADQIKSAYRRMAKMYHPDLYSTKSESEKKAAEAKFKEVQHAYDVLSDPQKKAAYDQFGSEDGPTMGAGNPFGAGGFTDIFSDIFSAFSDVGGRGRRQTRMQTMPGDDIEYTLRLDFKEACEGVSKDISFTRIEKCPTCSGSGAKVGTDKKRCSKCGGTGSITVNQRTVFGTMQTVRTCDACGGSGETIDTPCPNCSGKGRMRRTRTLKVNIPAGVDEGQILTMRGEGSASPGNGPNGNLLIIFSIRSHPLFKRDGFDLHFDLPITAFQAVLGAKIDIPTLDGITTAEIPAGTQSGTILRIRGKGIKHLRRDAYGDLMVRVVIDIPKGISNKQRKKLLEAEEVFADAKYEKIKAYNKTLREL
ncbi:MAG: molecular chaperone DnaJ [Christensenellales bacterium]|jgi:molecular chaperone DnaJ